MWNFRNLIILLALCRLLIILILLGGALFVALHFLTKEW